MAYAPTDFAPRENTFTQTSRPSKRSVFRRILDAIMASRQRQADYEIARFLQIHGSRLTDDAEREIERRFLTPSSGQL